MIKSMVSLVLFAIFITQSTTDQLEVQILCDTTFETGVTIRPLPGAIYRTVFPENEEPIRQIERETSLGKQIIDIPLPIELSGKVFPKTISPDGQYLALAPYEYGVPFVVWEIGTSEIATVQLPDTDVDYLNEFIVPTSLQQQVLTWNNNNTLLIRYFDLEVADEHLLAEKVLTVTNAPLQITAGVYQEISYPSLEAPPQSAFPRAMFSPQKNYVTLVSGDIGYRFQVYDVTGGQPQLVADLQHDSTREILGQPIWLSDESQFFMRYRKNPGTLPLQFAVAQVKPNQGFQVSHDLQHALEAAFGSNTSLAIPPISLLDSAGVQFILRISAGMTGEEYIVVYEGDTGDVTAICDDENLNPRTYFPIWGSNDKYFGRWYNGWITAYDLTTGEGYRTDGIGFIGWIVD